jgi:hypothetical protein
MESFKSFIEAFTRDEFALKQKLQEISNALVNMQMKEKGNVVGTLSHLPPEIAKTGATSDSSNAWEFLGWSLKDKPEGQIVANLGRQFNQVVARWENFVQQANNEYGLHVDTTDVKEAVDIQKRLVRHSYDALNRSEAGLRSTARRVGDERIGDFGLRRKPDPVEKTSPVINSQLQREYADGLSRKFYTMQTAFNDAVPFINKFFQSNPNSKSAIAWNEFLKYENSWSSRVKRVLPAITNSLPRRVFNQQSQQSPSYR